MKKFFNYLLAVVASAAALSCSQGFEEQEITPDVSERLVPMTITVDGEATRTFVGEDGKSICWHEDDKIAIFEGTLSSNKTIREFTIVPGSVSEDGKTATFTGEVEENSTKFYAIYPFKSVIERSSGTTFNVNMPAIQTLEDGNNVADGAIVSLGYFTSDQTSFNLSTVVGFLSVDITFEDVTSVEVCGTEIAGTTKFSKSTTSLPKVSDVLEAENTVTLLPEGEVFTPGTYYIALLPSTTPAGEFSIDFKRQSGITTLYISAKDIVIERNKGFKTTDSKWEKAAFGKITDAQTLVAFLEGAANIGDAEFGCDIDLQGVELPTATSFLGTLDCKGFALKNWNATAPLFENLAGTVKDLTIDSSCTLTPADAKGAFGFVARTVATTGALENITNNAAAITLNATAYGAGSDQTTDAVYFGTLAGQCYGKITGCTNNCDITIATTPTGDDERGVVYIGGLAGLADNDVQNCHNTGDISYTINGRGGYLYIGGVAGGTTTEKLAASTAVKAELTGCSNTGNISHIYPQSATAVGASDLNSNYTYVAGVIGYCEGSVTKCVNGVQGDSTKGAITLTTPTLTADYVVSRTTVAGVAGFAMTGGSECTNYGAITVEGSFGPGNDGTGTYLGGGNAKGASVAGVVAQAGVSTHFKTKTLTDCHNYGAVNCTFNMADNVSAPFYAGGVTANVMVETNNLTNNGVVTISSTGNSNYFGGVVGNAAANASNITNNGNVSITLARTADKQLATVHNYMGGVMGNMTTGNTLTTAVNNNPLTYTVNGAPEKAIYGAGVGGSLAIVNGATNNGDITITTADATLVYLAGVVAKTIGGDVVSMTNNGTLSYTGGTIETLYVAGVVCTSASSAIKSSSNTKDITINITDAGDVYLAGLFAYSGSGVAYSGLSNSGSITFTAPEAELDELRAGGICGMAGNASSFASCTNSGAMSLTAKSATTSYLAGIAAVSSSTSYALNATSCTNSGDLTASFPATTWYAGGIVAYGHNWSSSATKQYNISDNTSNCNISIAPETTSTKLFVGGIVGHSGMHTKYTSNSYKGTITVGSAEGMNGVGGLVGSTVLSSTSTNTNATYYNYTFAGNTVEATLPSTGNVGALIGGQYNASTSTVKSAPIFKYIFDTANPNTIKSTSSTTKAVNDYRDDARFTVTTEGLEGGVVIE
ncbi:MAG: hypothetical protein IJX65_07400 [Alistipes sp.]|nr:hypothetical protein [Alistipes sp.]